MISREAHRLDLLIALGHDLIAIQNLDQLLSSALQRILAYTDYDSGSVMLLDHATNALEVRASLGATPIPIGTQVPNIERSVAGRVLTTGQALVLHGRGEEVGTEWRDYTREIPSVICLPLSIREHPIIGVLILKSTLEAKVITPEDMETLGLLAAQLTAVIENARLHSERSELLSTLATREQQLQQLLGELLTAQEEERRRIAYDVHDGIAQTAASAYQHLQSFASRYRPRSPLLRENLQQSLDLVRRVVKDSRHLIAGLRPAGLDDLGLAVALRLEIEALWAAGWEIGFDDDPNLGRLSPVIETTLFRVAQEALQNVRKHAKTTRVQVSLQRTDTGARLIVRDWGCGIQADGARPRRGEHMGIFGIRERIGLLGGQFTIDGQSNPGTTLTVEIPLA